uniref:Tegument protein n=3 Tax=Macrostomum lignano TaxID=282301 RepID=A0A1I8FUC4_9PLAT
MGLQFFYSKQCRIKPGVYFEPGDAALAALLRPLHPHVFLYPRHDAGRDSAAAVLRAESPTHLELVFRLHPELQLAPFGAPRSVYLTPEGLEGRLIIRRSGGVEHLELGLPQPALANRSFSQIESPHDILETGVVSLPRLSVISLKKSYKHLHNWTNEISMPATLTILRSHMLPHLAAQFYANLSTALAVNSKALGAGDAKPIHVVLAVGSSQFGCDPNCRLLRDFAFADQYVMLRLRHYYTNVWINLADTGAVAEFIKLTGVSDTSKPFAPLTCQLLHPETLRVLANYEAGDLRKALQPPEDLPNPLPPTPEAVVAGAEPYPRPHGNLLSSQSPGEESPSAPEDPDIRLQQEQKAMDAIKQQVADSYMQFLMSSKA